MNLKLTVRPRIPEICKRASMNLRRVTCSELIYLEMSRVIWLQTPKVFWLGGVIFSLSYWLYMGLMMLGRQKYIRQNHWCVSRVPLSLRWPLKSWRYKSQSTAAFFTKARDRKTHSENHKLTESIWYKEELPVQWKKSIIVPIYRTDCSDYRGISLC